MMRTDPVARGAVLPREARLLGGPQDGARIKGVGGSLPASVFVGPRWLGDGYSAWAREPCPRFPVRYDYCGRGYLFIGWER